MNLRKGILTLGLLVALGCMVVSVIWWFAFPYLAAHDLHRACVEFNRYTKKAENSLPPLNGWRKVIDTDGSLTYVNAIARTDGTWLVDGNDPWARCPLFVVLSGGQTVENGVVYLDEHGAVWTSTDRNVRQTIDLTGGYFTCRSGDMSNFSGKRSELLEYWGKEYEAGQAAEETIMNTKGPL